MRQVLLLLGLLALVLAVPAAAQGLPQPTDVEVIDVTNDDGGGVGVLWNWIGATGEDTQIVFQVEVPGDLVDKYLLTERMSTTLGDARSELAEKLGPILPEMYQADELKSLAQEALTLAEANKDPDTVTIRRDFHKQNNAYDSLVQQRDKFWEIFEGKVNFGPRALFNGPIPRNLYERDRIVRYLNANLRDTDGEGIWLDARASSIRTKGDAPERFGHHPMDGDLNYVELTGFKVSHPDVIAGTYVNEPNDIDVAEPETLTLGLESNQTYNVRMIVREGGEEAIYTLGGATTKTGLFNGSKFNNFIFAIIFGLIIMSAIMLARRNPNLFIRRIAGLEAVDEAIGRATEMGKPVLYLCGLDSLATLSTLAAVNILGRVARRIADYDSDLVVPNRDPVVLTVAQEVVHEAYIEQGRPDAYKEDNIFFVTDDQFSFTATTCAIMMREKPAANFFMGYYYAESLLLAETGASTGAIQIAGTDALHQLPFFITTCDYTLIGEELYAASAYLSREPMLLGSLKGQDVGKAFIMVLIVIQTLLFIFNADWNWLKMLVEPI